MSVLLHDVATMGAVRPEQAHANRVGFRHSRGTMPQPDDATVDEIDRAIRYALDNGDLDPRIRDAFVDALLDRRLKVAGPG